MSEIENTFYPYCELCQGCGEDGCCSHLHCFSSLISLNKKCEYGEVYLKDSKFNELVANLGVTLIEELRESKITVEELIKKYDTKYGEIYEQVYKKE